MPCSLSQEEIEQYRREEILEDKETEVYRLIKWLAVKLRLKLLVRKTNLSDMTAELCSICTQYHREVNRITSDGHDGVARKLADWIDKHKQIDQAREVREKKEKLLATAKNTGLAKLTKIEREALGY